MSFSDGAGRVGATYEEDEYVDKVDGEHGAAVTCSDYASASARVMRKHAQEIHGAVAQGEGDEGNACVEKAEMHGAGKGEDEYERVEDEGGDVAGHEAVDCAFLFGGDAADEPGRNCGGNTRRDGPLLAVSR